MSELEDIEREIRKLEKEREELRKLRKLKLERLSWKIKLAPEKFAAKHPIVASAASLLKRGARFVYNNKLRAESNKSFAARLNVGEEKLNPETGDYVKHTVAGYNVRPAFKKGKKKPVMV